jgi:Mce-associated membrane protein
VNTVENAGREPGPAIPAPRLSPENESGSRAEPEPGSAVEPRAAARPWRRYAAAATLLALLLTAAGLFLAARSLRDPAATGNEALTDSEATSQVTGDVSNALGKIFAYTPDDTRSTELAARDLLEGTAAAQYEKLFTRIRQQVADQRLTLTTRVVRAGVVSLTADRATLLVFLDQTARRAGGPATGAAAQLSVTARLDSGGHWRITDLKAR